MSSNRLNKLLLICTLCLSLAATGCSAQWISVALADLPVLTQMALNIATLVSNVHPGEQLDASETAAIQEYFRRSKQGAHAAATAVSGLQGQPHGRRHS